MRDALGVQLFLIMEGDWFEREDRFTGLVHRFDRFLEMRRGCSRAEMTGGVYNHSYASWHGYTADASDKRVRVGLIAHPNRIRFIGHTHVANADVVASLFDVHACGDAKSRIAIAYAIVE